MSQTFTAKKGNDENRSNGYELQRYGLVGSSLFQKGNAGIARLLVAISRAGPDGMTTLDLLKALGAINYGQTLIKNAYKLGLIDRIRPQGNKKGYPVYNVLTPKGKALLKSQLRIT
jgi:hypothetical protein